jgi:hypothetical protein
MTSEVIFYLMKNLRLHNISIHRNCYQDRFINEYARKKQAKISESQSHGDLKILAHSLILQVQLFSTI